MPVRLLAAALGVAMLAAPASAAPSPDPRPVAGVPLEAATGLRLLVADDPPFLLDVDRGSVRRLPGLRPVEGGVVQVVAVGGRSAVVAVEAENGRARLYSLRGAAPRVSALGRGAEAVPAADGRTVGVKRRSAGGRCSLQRVGLGGRVLEPARADPCAARIGPDTRLGLVVAGTRVVDPSTGRTRLRTSGRVLAAAGSTLVLAKDGGELALLDMATGAERLIGRPSELQGPGEAAVDRGGRYVAVEYGDPAWRGGPEQALDVWVVDTATGELAQLPGSPALVSLKATSMAWTADGRLVLLGERDRAPFVAAWRPGEPTLAVRPIGLPRRDGGSDSFAVVG
jgi:hypothetical protein